MVDFMEGVAQQVDCFVKEYRQMYSNIMLNRLHMWPHARATQYEY